MFVARTAEQAREKWLVCTELCQKMTSSTSVTEHVFSLCVGMAVFRMTQDCLRVKLCSGFALFFCVCLGVG